MFTRVLLSPLAHNYPVDKELQWAVYNATDKDTSVYNGWHLYA